VRLPVEGEVTIVDDVLYFEVLLAVDSIRLSRLAPQPKHQLTTSLVHIFQTRERDLLPRSSTLARAYPSLHIPETHGASKVLFVPLTELLK
jgi:hypothetical protein